MIAVVFVGPTLNVAEAAQHLDGIFLPPVSRGEFFKAAAKDPCAIGIIDGFFDQVPSVWHKEILWALAAGIPVFGSSSMGALRACELAPFGMVGVGEIFRAFSRGELEDDDEVAIAHLAREHGFRPVSEAMANMRATLKAALAARVVTSEFVATISFVAKARPYPERSWKQALADGEAAGLSPALIDQFTTWLPTGKVDQKRLDAIEMLKVMNQLLKGESRPLSNNFTFEQTNAWDIATTHWRAE